MCQIVDISCIVANKLPEHCARKTCLPRVNIYDVCGIQLLVAMKFFILSLLFPFSLFFLREGERERETRQDRYYVSIPVQIIPSRPHC